MSTLTEKVILVTGASRGIGATIAQRLARAGAKVIVNYAGSKEPAEKLVEAIKAEGGIAIVQTPESAGYAGMPRSSIAADHVDMVLPPAEIALELGRLGHQFMGPDVRSLEEGQAAADNEQVLGKVLQLLRMQSGLDLRGQ